MLKKTTTDQKTHILFALTLLVLTIFRIIYAGSINLSCDEAYYWGWSQKLSLGYYDSGAILAFISRFFLEIIGHSEIGMRMGSIVFSLGTSIMLYIIALSFVPAMYAFMIVVLFSITPGGILLSILMMHDSLMAFFWICAVWSIYKATTENKSVFWYFAGIFAGFGLWSKDTMVLIIPSTLFFLLLSKDNRFWLKKKEPYFFIIIMFLIFSPIIIWNAAHNWVTYRHIFALGTRRESFISLKTFSEFLGSQLGIISPFIWLGIAGSWIYIIIKWWKKRSDKLLFIFSYSGLVLLFFSCLSLRSEVEGNWPGFSYYLGIISFIYVMKKMWEKGRKKFCISFMSLALFFTLLISTIILIPGILYFIVPRLPIAKHQAINILKTDRTNEVHGWDELGAKLYKIEQELEDKDFFIFSLRYQISAQLKFYYPIERDTYCFPISRRMNQFDIWGGLDKIIGRSGLLIIEKRRERMVEGLKQYFESIEFIKDINVHRPKLIKGPIRSYKIYYCKTFKGLPEELILTLY